MVASTLLRQNECPRPGSQSYGVYRMQRANDHAGLQFIPHVRYWHLICNGCYFTISA